MANTKRQSTSWIGTVPLDAFKSRFPDLPFAGQPDPGPVLYVLPEPCCFLRGQYERGESGYEHAQFVAYFIRKLSLRQVIGCLGPGHYESTRSAAADAYVWKDDTAIPDSRFEIGTRPHRRNSKADWDAIWASAVRGNLESVPASLRVVHYRTLRAIATDHMEPPAHERTCQVFWGATGTGKSRDAWLAAGMDAYAKDPRSKFWCGYRGQRHVILDEFRGGIDVSHLLRWLDRYPVVVEVKGGAQPLLATTFWITSNVSPSFWYPDLDAETLAALLRRLNVVQYSTLT